MEAPGKLEQQSGVGGVNEQSPAKRFESLKQIARKP
jgi:hypothetical protein